MTVRTPDYLNLVQPGFFAPEFELEKVQGGWFRLSNELKKGPLVLHFFPGGWSPVCVASLKKAQRILPEFGKRKGLFAAISPESKTLTRRLAEREGLAFPLLADVYQSTIRRYGLLNSKSERPAPYPSFFVIDREGMIRFKRVILEEADWPDMDTLLNELEKYSEF